MKSSFRLSTLLFFTILFVNCNSFSQNRNNYSTQIDSVIKTANPLFNGVILIAKNGKTVYTKVHGFSNFKTKKPLKIDSQFEIMSNTRQITAVLILKEVEKKRIDLQAPIKKYLPELTQTWADTVTVHQLLNHTHGIVDPTKPLVFKPGSQFKYGNAGYPYLGKIIEHIYKKSYSEVANDYFKSLKMKHTFCYAPDKIQNVVTGYINDKTNIEPTENTLLNNHTIPSGGIISTVGDLAIWNNNLHKGKLLKPETYQLLFKYNITAQHGLFGKEKVGYGYGFRIVEKEPIKYVGHTGLGDGFSSLNLYYPENDVSLIILENQMNAESALFYANEIKIRDILIKSNLFN